MSLKQMLQIGVLTTSLAASGAAAEGPKNVSPEDVYKQAIESVKESTKKELDDILTGSEINALTEDQLGNLKDYLDLKVQCEELGGGQSCGNINIELSEEDKLDLNVSGFAYESEFLEEYLQISKGDEKIANIFAGGEQEIRNNPKVKPKRLERTVKVYISSLKEVFDGNGEYMNATEKFFKKYTPDTYKELLQIEGDLKAINRINQEIAAENEKQAAENEKQEKLREIQLKIDELAKKLESLQ